MPDRTQLNTAVQAAVTVVEKWLDNLQSKAPLELEPGISAVRAQFTEQAAQLGPELVGNILSALGQAVLTGDWGPADYNPTDVA